MQQDRGQAHARVGGIGAGFRALQRLAVRLRVQFRGNLGAMLFTSALVLIGESMGWIEPFAKASLMITSEMAARHAAVGSHQALTSTGSKQESLPADAGPVSVVIDDHDFLYRYHEISPLDRCLLTEDLSRLMDAGALRMGVDLDLSPLLLPDERTAACQRKLDAWLDAHADRLVLMLPFPTGDADPAVSEMRGRWLLARCTAGARFGDVALDLSAGISMEMPEDAAGTFSGMLFDPEDGGFCNRLQGKVGKAEPDTHRGQPINFAVAVDDVPAPMPLHDLFAQSTDLKGRVVLFGGNWGQDDRVMTPIGEQAGIWLHAARLVTLKHPLHEMGRLAGFLLDLLIAWGFSLLIDWFWTLYVALYVDEHRQARPWRPKSAWSSVLLIAFMLAYASYALMVFILARYVYLSRGILIEPLVIALGMLVDGFVSGPVTVLSERMLEARGDESSGQAKTLRRRVLASTAMALAVALLLACNVRTGLVGDGSLVFCLAVIATIAVALLLLPGPGMRWQWREPQAPHAERLRHERTDIAVVHPHWWRRAGMVFGVGQWIIFMGAIVYAGYYLLS
jgi:hypothetical protein